MDASIKGDNIRTFVRLLQCAAKYGDDLNIHATPKVWEMSVTNSSKSAFCLFKLEKSFFCRWDPKTRKGVKCRLLVKSVLAVLGKTSQITTVNRVDLRIVDPSDDLRPPQHQKKGARGRREGSATRSHHAGDDELQDERRFGNEDDWEESDDAKVGIEAKLIMRLVCKHGVTKKHSLHLASSDFLRANVDPDTTPSGFVIITRTLRDWLDHFSLVSSSGYGSVNQSGGGTNQLGWMFTRNEVRVKSWEAMGGGGLSTEIKVDVDEFDDYEITEDRIDLTLPMKEFKATLVLAEQLSATLNISFSEPGQPLTLTSLDKEFEDFSIFCAIATTICEAFTDVRGAGPQMEIKRSSSSLARSRNPSQASNTGTGRGDGRAESPAIKRRSSEISSQSRKRSTLSLTSHTSEDQHDVHAGPSRYERSGSRLSQDNHNYNHSQNQRALSQGHADVDMGGSGQGQDEPLFMPMSQSAPMSQLPPGMSQKDVDDLVEGLDVGDLDDDLGEEDHEKEDERDKSNRRDQEAPGPSQQQQPQNPEGLAQSQDPGEGGDAAAGPSVPRRGISVDQSDRADSNNITNAQGVDNAGRGSDTKDSDQTKSSVKSGPSWVSDSVKDNTTSEESQPSLIWDLPGDHGPLAGAEGTGADALGQGQGPGQPSAVQGIDQDVNMAVEHGEDQDEEGENVDELDEDEDGYEPTQNQGGSTRFNSLFPD
ncbi:hypothetical protein IAU59_003316 [Kwoniella sp. CBS 9459]